MEEKMIPPRSRRRGASSGAAATAVLFLLSATYVDASFSVVIPSGSEECFIVRAPAKRESTITGNYDCLDDGMSPDPVSVALYNSKMETVWKSTPGEPEGTFRVSGSGQHELCIQNGMMGADDMIGGEDGRDRNIGFALRVSGPSRSLDGGKEGPDEERALRLLNVAENLYEDFETLMDHQDYLRDRESSHRDLVELTFSRIVRWTVAEAVALVLIATGQVLYLRKFFETRRYL